MKAVIFSQYGSPEVLHLVERPKPTPKDNEILVKIKTTTVTAGDCEIRSFNIPTFLWLPIRMFIGLRNPRDKILGQEFAGRVEAVGKDVKNFQVGDDVFGNPGITFGAYAEYLCVTTNLSDSIVSKIPPTMTYEEATTIPVGGLVSTGFLRKANIQQGERVLINGAGGSIGTYGIQIAKSLGAHVTAIDNAEKLEMLRSIGADEVIDYAEEDFTESNKRYDIVFDIVGKKLLPRAIKVLKPNGRYLLANPRLAIIIRGLWLSKTSDKRVFFESSKYILEDISYLKMLIETGKVKAVIDKTYPLEQIVEAHRYVDTGRKKGNLVIVVDGKTSE